MRREGSSPTEHRKVRFGIQLHLVSQSISTTKTGELDSTLVEGRRNHELKCLVVLIVKEIEAMNLQSGEGQGEEKRHRAVYKHDRRGARASIEKRQEPAFRGLT